MSTTNKQAICSSAAGTPIGPFSQAIVVNNTMYISGQIGGSAQSNGDLVPGGVEKQTEQALNNMQLILHEAGAHLSNVVKVNVLLLDIKDWPVVNTVYAKYFQQPFPARAAYQVAALPKGALIEIEAVAVLNKS